MFLITVNNDGIDFWLRSTVWTFSRDRASTFASREEAQAALDKAKKFMVAKIYKSAKIIEV